jgi:hypothetical protein
MKHIPVFLFYFTLWTFFFLVSIFYKPHRHRKAIKREKKPRVVSAVFADEEKRKKSKSTNKNTAICIYLVESRA